MSLYFNYPVIPFFVILQIGIPFSRIAKSIFETFSISALTESPSYPYIPSELFFILSINIDLFKESLYDSFLLDIAFRNKPGLMIGQSATGEMTSKESFFFLISFCKPSTRCTVRIFLAASSFHIKFDNTFLIESPANIRETFSNFCENECHIRRLHLYIYSVKESLQERSPKRLISSPRNDC